MIDPPLSPDEPHRLASLRSLDLVDTPMEERFERVTRLARRLLDAPVAAVSLVEADRQWFKSIQGLPVPETTRTVSFCGHTILGREILIVPDAREDPRFHDNPLVSGDPYIVFYAGCPVQAPDGSTVASLCVIDHEPRTMTREDAEVLRDLATLVENEMCTTVMSSVQADLIAQTAAKDRKTLVDPLTCLWNNDGIHGVLERAAMQSRQDGAPLAVTMASVDRFDRLPAGDEVLRELGRRMLRGVRECDGIGHCGDGKFMIVMEGCGTPEHAIDAAESLRRRVAEEPVLHEMESIDVTISAGLAYTPAQKIVDVNELVRCAEAALEQARVDGGVVTRTVGRTGRAAA